MSRGELVDELLALTEWMSDEELHVLHLALLRHFSLLRSRGKIEASKNLLSGVSTLHPVQPGRQRQRDVLRALATLSTEQALASDWGRAGAHFWMALISLICKHYHDKAQAKEEKGKT